jgi:trehalose 6-phosphate phosphatase
VTVAVPGPSTPEGRAGLAALLSDPGRALVGLDFDGTLAPIVDDPEQARALPQARAAMARLAPRLGTLAVITGRPAAVAVDFGGFAGAAGLESLVVLGHYGRERWAQGRTVEPPTHPGVEDVRRELPGVLAGLDLPEGVSVEDKVDALAVHTRRSTDPERALSMLQPVLADLAARHGLALEPGRLVLELRPPGFDKGAALRDLVASSDPSVVVYAGDDLGDLAAYDAVAELRAEGLPGLLVCSGSREVVELSARADLVVDGPEGMASWLDRIADRLDLTAS